MNAFFSVSMLCSGCLSARVQLPVTILYHCDSTQYRTSVSEVPGRGCAFLGAVQVLIFSATLVHVNIVVCFTLCTCKLRVNTM